MFQWIRFSKRLRIIGIVNIVCFLTLYLLLGLLHLNIKSWSSFWLENNSELSLFLSKNISPKAYQDLYVALEQDFRIRNFQEFSSIQSFLLLQKQIDAGQELLETIDKTILPTTIDLQIRPEYYTQTAAIVRELQETEGITHVVFPKQAFEAAGYFSQTLNQFAPFLVFLIGILGIFILFFLLHLSFQQNWQALELLNLSGVSFFSIRLIFLLEVGLVLGISLLLSYSITFICYQMSLHFSSLQQVSLFLNRPIIFYEWKDLIILGFFTLFIGEVYAYWMVERWCARLRMH